MTGEVNRNMGHPDNVNMIPNLDRNPLDGLHQPNVNLPDVAKKFGDNLNNMEALKMEAPKVADLNLENLRNAKQKLDMKLNDISPLNLANLGDGVKAPPLTGKQTLRLANPTWAAQSQADDINKRQAWWLSLLKDVIGYGAASGVVAASSGLAALTQPVFRTLANMIHHAMSADKNGANSQDASAGSPWDRALGSLKRDLEAAWEVVTNAFNNPKKTLHEKLLKGSNAYKNWGHIGALMGGLIGGAGGPGAAFLGFLVGRYVGEAFGRVLSYATGNSGFTFEETVQQSLTLGLKGLTPEQAQVKVKRIEELRGEVEKAIKRCPSDQSLPTDPLVQTCCRL